jgi:flagellar biosynthesis chaperone FliJ
MHSLQPRTQIVAKNYTVVSKLEEHRNKYKKMKSRLENKRELLAKMQSKRNALLLWMEKKGRVKEKESKVARF